jgi:prevent-host-death family protein
MDTKTTLSISQARKEIFRIAEKVQRPSTYYTLTENGKPKAVVLSAEEFESWQETLEINRIFPNLAKDIKAAEKDLKAKKYTTLEEVLSKEGFILASK